MAYLRLNGFDVLPYIKDKGLRWEEIDIEGRNAGKTLDGKDHPDTLSKKRSLQIDCGGMNLAAANQLLNAISPDTFILETDIDPKYGTTSFEVKCKRKPATCLAVDKSGATLWDDISFPINEL